MAEISAAEPPVFEMSLSVSQTWLLFRHKVLLIATCLLGPKSFQATRGTKSNAVYSHLKWEALPRTSQHSKG